MEGLICLEHKLSIVIPVYNGGDLLIRTLDALCSQTFGDFEMIVIDDGSTDDTAVRLARYAEKEPRLKSFTVQNGGPSRARNYGISKAEGDYLYLCDADDLPEPTLLERLTKELDGGADLAACGYWQERVSESGETVSSPFSEGFAGADGEAADVCELEQDVPDGDYPPGKHPLHRGLCQL